MAETFTFFGDFKRLIYAGHDLEQGLAAANSALRRGEAQAAVVFHDATGAMTEVNPRESAEDFVARARAHFRVSAGEAGPSLEPNGDEPARPGRGRPKLGVVCREVSLLPRHWEWLGSQPGKASATLRKLVEEAIRQRLPEQHALQARDAAYRVMSQLAGRETGYEEVSRALFAGRFDEIGGMTAQWEPEVRDYLIRMFKQAAFLADRI